MAVREWARKTFSGANPPASVEAPKSVGDYELVRLLGRGGMADIYVGRIAVGPRTGQPIAIKLLNAQLARDQQTIALLLRECEVMKLMDHHLIVKTIDGGVANGMQYMVMDLVDGRDLAALRNARA